MREFEGKVILVTGAAGFVGTHLANRLSAIADAKLLLLSRESRLAAQANVCWIQEELSLLTPERWRAIGVTRIDFVFHLAAYTPKASATAEPIDEIIDSNISGTRALLRSLPGRPRKFVYSSTIDVYQQPTGAEAITERSKLGPSSLYGASKLFCENLVATWAIAHECECAILRYGHIFGPGEEAYAKLIPVVVRNLLAGRAPIVNGDGSALRDYMYVDDAVEATLRAALVQGNVGPINVVRGEPIALKDLVCLLISIAGVDLPINFAASKPNGHSLRFDREQMTNALGDWQFVALEDGLAAEIESFKNIAAVKSTSDATRSAPGSGA